MKYRIEMEMVNSKYKWTDKSEYVNGVAELKTFLKECLELEYRVTKIVKCYKDGSGEDVTKKYIRFSR